MQERQTSHRDPYCINLKELDELLSLGFLARSAFVASCYSIEHTTLAMVAIFELLTLPDNEM